MAQPRRRRSGMIKKEHGAKINNDIVEFEKGGDYYAQEVREGCWEAFYTPSCSGDFLSMQGKWISYGLRIE